MGGGGSFHSRFSFVGKEGQPKPAISLLINISFHNFQKHKVNCAINIDKRLSVCEKLNEINWYARKFSHI